MGQHSYRLATFAVPGGQPSVGLVVDESVVDLAAALTAVQARSRATPLTTMLDVLQHWGEVHPHLGELAYNVRVRAIAYDSVPLSRVRLLAPILYPGTIFCAGANYRDHVVEMSKALNLPPEPDPHERGLKPWHFIKPSASCVRGTQSPIALPAYSKKVDWEAEIAVVIGRECRNVSIEDALQCVAGLTIANDLSARDHLRRQGVAADSPFHFDWVSQKSFDGALPLGPWIVPLQDIGDPANLGIKLWVNEELMQDSSSSNLIFSMAEQISHLSTRLTLRPGDLIVTGTPAGSGAARGRFLQTGDRVRVWVEGIGELTNDFTA